VLLPFHISIIVFNTRIAFMRTIEEDWSLFKIFVPVEGWTKECFRIVIMICVIGVGNIESIVTYFFVKSISHIYYYVRVPRDLSTNYRNFKGCQETVMGDGAASR